MATEEGGVAMVGVVIAWRKRNWIGREKKRKEAHLPLQSLV